MTRIPLADSHQQPEHIRELTSGVGSLDVMRLIANAPNVFPGWARMAGDIFAKSTFSPRLREIIILRVAHLQESPYELAQHHRIAKSVGLSEHEIDAATHAATTDFSAEERVALETVTELCTTRRLSDDTFASAQATFGDEALTELLMIVSAYYGLALVLNAVDLDIDEPRS
jgi:4-carboxymuconolactone decarboxylase